MRRLALLLLSLLCPFAAFAADSLALAQRLAQEGLPRLALARIERDQPQATDAPHWLEWESLRLTVLSQTGQSAELLRRVARLPTGLPEGFVQKAHGHAAWAWLEQGQGAAARDHLARLLWGHALSAADQQWARRLVIRSWLADHRPDEAYRAMLRFQQDFAPLGREVASEFVRGLLAEGRAAEALTWLDQLEPRGALATATTLQAGLFAPEAAIDAARAALARQPAAVDWLRVLADAAQRAGQPALSIDALERWLAAGFAEAAGPLWQAYLTLGEAMGNRAQVLLGDDASWLAMAAGLAPTEALEARAVWAYLSQTGREAAAREQARARLFAALVGAGRTEAAVRLVQAAPWGGPAAGEGLRVAEQAIAFVPDAQRRELLLALARLAAGDGRRELAADYAVQAVLESDMGAPDRLATQALRTAVDYLGRAGLDDEALALHQRVVGERQPAARAGSKPAAQAGKPRRRP